MGYETDISTVLLEMHCTFCNKVLRRPVSIERGSGDDCDAKYMEGAGGAGVAARMGQAFNEQDAEEALRSAPDIVPEHWSEPTKVAKKGQLIKKADDEEPVKAKGGEVLEARPIKPGSLREYWLQRGGDPNDPNAEWRTSIEARAQLVSYGIWYASRAATFGFAGHESTADKVDPRFLVIASVQRFARAVGLHEGADAIANFYAARLVQVVKAKLAGTDEKDVILFETDVAGGPDFIRLHAPYSEQYNRLCRENRDVFLSYEKDPPYFWRYFRRSDLRKVINILQSCFGDRPSLTRKMLRPEQRRQRDAERSRMKRIVDAWTGEVRLFPPDVARRLLTEQPKVKYKSRLRYQEV